MTGQTNTTKDNKEQKRSYYTTIYPNFKDLTAFSAINTSFLLGQGFYHLQEDYRLNLAQIGYCFAMTGANVARAISIFKKYEKSNRKDSNE